MLKVKDAAGEEKYLKVTGAGTLLDPFIPTHDSSEVVVNEDNFINKYLLNAASNDMGVNGASSAVEFNYSPPEGKKLIAGRIMIYLEMTGNFDSIKFGGITALGNGCQILCNDNEIDNWQDNIDMVTTFHDAPGLPQFAKETKSLSGRWTLSKAAKGFNGLTVLETSGFSIKIRDDLSAAGIYFRAKIQGRLVDV